MIFKIAIKKTIDILHHQQGHTLNQTKNKPNILGLQNIRILIKHL